jgi:peptidoglycan hydrolase CwlO-like protein
MNKEKIEKELEHAKEQANKVAGELQKTRVSIERFSMELEQWKGAIAAYENLLKPEEQEE